MHIINSVLLLELYFINNNVAVAFMEFENDAGSSFADLYIWLSNGSEANNLLLSNNFKMFSDHLFPRYFSEKSS